MAGWILPERSMYFYLTWKDVERCPFALGTRGEQEWSKEDDERLKKIAISRGWKDRDEGTHP